jgi:hypothetical protein
VLRASACRAWEGVRGGRARNGRKRKRNDEERRERGGGRALHSHSPLADRTLAVRALPAIHTTKVRLTHHDLAHAPPQTRPRT